jgi:hypothetical protein
MLNIHLSYKSSEVCWWFRNSRFRLLRSCRPCGWSFRSARKRGCIRRACAICITSWVEDLTDAEAEVADLPDGFEEPLADAPEELFDEPVADEPAAAATLFGLELDLLPDTADGADWDDFPGAAAATLVGLGTGALSLFGSSTGFASGFMTCHHGRCLAGAGAGAAATVFLEVATGAGVADAFWTGETLAFGAGSAADGRGAPSVGTGGLSEPEVGTGAVV